jgi:hypothetical protein
MRRFVCIFLTALGLGMIVGGISFTPNEPPDPAMLLEHWTRGTTGEKSSAEMQQMIQTVMQFSDRGAVDPRRQDHLDTYRAVSSALKGFGTAFFVFGLLGLTIPLLHRSLKQATESKPTGPPGI